jgi:RNA recognition motif-containing protein
LKTQEQLGEKTGPSHQNPAARESLADILPKNYLVKQMVESILQQQAESKNGLSNNFPGQDAQAHAEEEAQDTEPQDNSELPSRHLFVANIGPDTSEHKLSLQFSLFGKVESVKLVRRAMGFSVAFIHFEHVANAVDARTKLQVPHVRHHLRPSDKFCLGELHWRPACPSRNLFLRRAKPAKRGDPCPQPWVGGGVTVCFLAVDNLCCCC